MTRSKKERILSKGVIARAALLLCASCLPPATVLGQEAESSERAFFEELPIVSVSRLPQTPTNTPGAVTVFDRDFIRATGYRDIYRLLKLVPGMLAVNEYGHTPLVAYHGLGTDFPNRMQVLIDGRSVYSPLDVGGVDWNSLPITMDEIDRIEVVRGSNSAAYGSNAFLGVVNIITRSASQDQGIALDANYGQDSYKDAGLRVGAQRDGLSVRLVGRHVSDEGNDFINDYRQMNIGTLRADYNLSPQLDFTLSAGINDGNKGWGYAGSPNNTDGQYNIHDRSSFAQLRVHYIVNPANELMAEYYHNSETIDAGLNWYFPAFGFPVVPVNYNRRGVRDNFDFQQTVTPFTGLRLAWGGEVRRDFASASTFFYSTGDDQDRLMRTFLNTEWQALHSLVFNAGAMWEHYNDEVPRVSPRAFANWTYVDGHAVRVGFSKAYREASLFEQHADERYYADGILLQQVTRGSGMLRPERMYSKEAGLVGAFRTFPLSYDVRAFREDLSDLIDTTSAPSVLPAVDPSVQTYVNFPDRVRIQGVEYQIKVKPWPEGEITYGEAFVRIQSNDASPSRIYDQVNSVPAYSYSVSWLQRYPYGFSTTVILNGVASMVWSGLDATPGYRSVDARIAKTFRLEQGGRFELALNALNLGPRRQEYGFNTSYTPPNPTISRIVFVSARAEF
jgi:iron complex outermembrane receptor protein